MTDKLSFDAIPGHREIEKPELPSTDFSAIPGWRNISPAPSVEEETASESEPNPED
jgi:hypothetical protein